MIENIRNSILIVDDEPTNIHVLVQLLGSEYTLYAAKDGQTALEMAKTNRPDLVLLDILMPIMDGYQVLTQLREIEETRNTPVIFITGLTSEEDEERGLELDAVDYINKPFKGSIVKLRIRNQIKIINALKTIEHLSNTDLLTGLPNRRSFTTRLNSDWNRAIRESTLMSIIIADVDNFKNYNDSYGHIQGDVALRTVANCLENSLRRKTDMVARWGGEEFAVLLPLATVESIPEIAEQLRKTVENAKFSFEGKKHNVTISLGCNTIIPTENCVIDDFIAKADNALYVAKQQGRNRVAIAQSHN